MSRSETASAAYNLWASTYDDQQDNLMLRLDDEIFTRFISNTQIKGRNILDIGCGTGRHWEKLYALDPARLTGVDISREMITRLHVKHPHGEAFTSPDLSLIENSSYDIIISTLTIAHIEDLESALQEWLMKLKLPGEIIITDFHPEALVHGGKRTFHHNGEQINIVNHIHHVDDIIAFFEGYGFEVVEETERYVDESVREYYVRANALHVYEKFFNVPIIYGLHLKRIDAIA